MENVRNMDSIEILGCCVQVLYGIILCFFGFRFMKGIISITGAIIGFSLGIFIVTSFTNWPVFLIFASGMVGGLLLGYASFALFKLGVFFLGAFFGANILQLTICLFGEVSDKIVIALLILAALIGGTLAIKFTKPIIIFGTSFSGAYAIVHYGLKIIFPNGNMIVNASKDMDLIIQNFLENSAVSNDHLTVMMFAMTIIVCIVGITIQYSFTAPKE